MKYIYIFVDVFFIRSMIFISCLRNCFVLYLKNINVKFYERKNYYVINEFENDWLVIVSLVVNYL